MAERLTFTLEGRDQLSRVLNHAGESADRLRATMEDAADGSGQALLHLTQDADGRLRDMEGRFVSAADAAALMATRTGELERPTTSWAEAADKAGKAGEALKKALITLAPAAIPAAASLAPIAPAVLAGAAAAGVFAVAVGAQISAMTDAAEAEKKYTDAVEQNGAASEQAIKAQAEYARQMAKLPPATRQAAAALSVFKDSYQEWSDSLAKDTMGPVVKGLAVMQGILPKLTPMVKGFAGQLDRTVTLAAGGVASPGFDAFAKRMGKFSEGVLDRANDGLVTFLRTLDTGQVGQGVGQFLDWARQQGPVVGDILRNLGETLLHVLEAASETGVGMLQVVGVLAELAAAVPPEMISTLLQLAVAIKVVNLAAAGAAAGRTAMAALGTQLVTMRTAAAGAPGPLAAAGAAINTLSRTAKLAIAGTGIGLLVIALSELAANSSKAPPDVDKLTSSLKQLGAGSKVGGEAAKAFGQDLAGLYEKVQAATDPSTVDDIQQWIVTLGGLGSWDSTPVKEGKENLEAIDQALASLVGSGDADLAAAAARRLSDAYVKGGGSADQFTGSLDSYDTAVANARFESDLAADAMGLFGKQAQATQAKLDAQKASADGLRQSIVALNNVNRQGISAQIGFEQALDDSTKAAEENAGALDMVDGQLVLNSEKSRTAATALTNLASKTDEATTAARESGASWQTVNGIYERGRQQLIKNAMQMGLNKQQAAALADQILKTPDKTAKLKGNIEDLQAKLADAKRRLASVPDSKKAAIRAEISQLQAQIAKAKGEIASVKGKTVSVMVEYRTKNSGASDFTKSIGGYAGGGNPRAGEWAWVGEEGPELVQFQQPGTRVYDHQTSMGMVGNFGAVVPARPAPVSIPAVQPSPGRAAASSSGAVTINHFHIENAMDPVRVGQEVQKVLLKLKRTNGGEGLGLG